MKMKKTVKKIYINNSKLFKREMLLHIASMAMSMAKETKGENMDYVSDGCKEIAETARRLAYTCYSVPEEDFLDFLG